MTAAGKQQPILPRTLSWSMLAILLTMPVWPFLSTWWGSFGGLHIWKSLPTILLTALMVVGLIYLVLCRRDVLAGLFKRRLVWCAAVFAGIVLVSIPLSAASFDAKLAATAMDLRYLLAFIMALAVAQLDAPFWRKVLAKVPTAAIIIGVALAILGLIQVAFLPSDFLSNFGYGPGTTAPSVSIDQTGVLRAFATLRGPNDYAAFLILPLLFAALSVWRRRSVWSVLAFVTIAAGILASSSRSAFAAAALALFGLVFMQLPKTIYKTKRFWAATLGLVLVGAAALTFALNNSYLRLHILHIRDDHSAAVATSNSDHADHTKNSLNRIVRQPLGCGAGCSGPASYYGSDAKISENYYLQIAEEYGLIGLAVWGATILLITFELWKKRRDMVCAVVLSAFAGYLLIGLLLHVFVDEPLTVTWFMLAGILVGLPALKKPHQSGKILLDE